MKDKIRNLFSKIPWKRSQSDREIRSLDDELEQITDKLIKDTVGPKGVLTAKFDRCAGAFDPRVNPISEKEAVEIMLSMIKIAVSRRKLMVERCATSVEAGGLFDRHYRKMHQVSKLAVICNANKRRLQRAEEELAYFNEMKKKVRQQVFVEHIQPADDPSGKPVDTTLYPTGQK